MKKKFLSVLFALVLVLSFSLVTAVPVAAQEDPPSTIESSTMIFQGTLFDAGGEVYTGTVPMVEIEGELGDNVAGFDVYAKVGGEAYVMDYYGEGPWNGPGGFDTYIIGPNHDAYHGPGPWGPWYDPDCADWDMYSLELTADHWYLRYTTTGESPMSGVMDWNAMYAEETDKGTCDLEDDGGPFTVYEAGGPHMWDWDAGAQVERIPLAFPGFDVTVNLVSGDIYLVTLAPAAGDNPPGPVINEDTGESYGAIQPAIDAPETLDTHTITVAAGTYPEKVIIDKSLTLNGAKVGQDARTRTFTGESILDGTSFPPLINDGAFTIEDGVSNVIIDGFEIRNYQSGDPGGGSAVLAYSYGAETEGLSQITIQNNFMHDIGWNGVCVWSNNGVVQEYITVQFNLIVEAPYAGIELTNVTNSQVLNNEVIAPTVIADDPGDAGVGIEIAVRAHPGITITAGTNVLVEGNEISGAFAEGSRAAINILSRTYASDSNATLTGVTVRGNTVSASVPGSPAILADAESREGGPAAITNLAILDNPITDFSKAGIVVKNVASVQIEGNVISTTDHSFAPNGIQVGYVMDPTATTGTVKGNQVSGCSWSGYVPEETYDGEENWTGSGILVIAPNSGLEISENEVQSCDVAMDIEAGSGTLITNNDVHDNSYGFVLWNANPTISFNNIYQNALYGVYRTFDLTGILDAINNYWGNASGPIPPGTYDSYGDKVSDNVTFEPWLLVEDGTPYGKTLALKDGWTLVSTDKAVAEAIWVGTNPLVVELPEETIMELKYTPTGGFVSEVTPADLQPVNALYVKTDGGGGVGINYPADADPVVNSKDLEAGWNLISIPSINADTRAILSPLRYVQVGEQQGVGLATLVSQGDYNQFGEGFYKATLTDADWDALNMVLRPFNGYWAYMNAAKTFVVIP